MKKILFIAMLLAFTDALVAAQGKAPSAVTIAFNQKFPEAKNVHWDKENAHEYEASFVWNASKYSANFSDSGEWLETESAITFNQLPEKVQAAFKAVNKASTIKAVAKIETLKGKIKYEIEIKKGIKTTEFFYDSDGVVLKK